MKTEIYTPCHFEAGVLHDAIVYMDVCNSKGGTVRIYNKTDFRDNKLAAIQYLAKYIERNELPDYTDAETYSERIKEWSDDIEIVYSTWGQIQEEKYFEQVKLLVDWDFAMEASDVKLIIFKAYTDGEDPAIPAKIIYQNCMNWCNHA